MQWSDTKKESSWFPAVETEPSDCGHLTKAKIVEEN